MNAQAAYTRRLLIASLVVTTGPTAAEMQRDAECKYDGPIPVRVRAAIAERKAFEAEQEVLSTLTPDQQTRYLAGKAFGRAKRSCDPLPPHARADH